MDVRPASWLPWSGDAAPGNDKPLCMSGRVRPGDLPYRGRGEGLQASATTSPAGLAEALAVGEGPSLLPWLGQASLLDSFFPEEDASYTVTWTSTPPLRMSPDAAV